MPNYCHNELLIFDNTEAEDGSLIKAFRERAVGPDPVYKSSEIEELISEPASDRPLNKLCFNQFVPVPALLLARQYAAEDVLKREDKLDLLTHPDTACPHIERVDGCISGYKWQIKYWGTKWGAWDVTVGMDWALIYRFTTAWSWPLPVVAEMARLYPALQFQLMARTEYDRFEGLHYARFQRGKRVCQMGPVDFVDVPDIAGDPLHTPL